MKTCQHKTQVYKTKPDKNILSNSIQLYLFSVKEAILRAHPDLAGKLAQDNNLTPESTREQAAAGLSDIPRDKQDAIGELNARYKDKFDFPFVICARENKIESILKGLTSRLENGREQEVLIGTGEIKKICWYRIIELIS